MPTWTRTAFLGVLLATAAVPAMAQNAIQNYTPLTDEMLKNPDPADWPMYRRNYQGWGYSPLDQVTKDNVGGLRLVWSRVMEPGSNETTPLVHDGVMFLGQTNDVIQAIDAKSGDLIWEYRRQLPDHANMQVLGGNKRSVALYQDKVIFISWDNHVVALDAKTGQVAWDTDRGQGGGGPDSITNTAGPMVMDGVVMAGSSCQFSGFGCYETGTDATNGEELWRHNFIPQEGEPGDETWGGLPFKSRWMTGSWGGITYSPELNLAFFGSTGVGPASEAQRGNPGARMAGTNTRFAVNPKTGEVAWSHQVLPEDNWDSECTYEALIVDTNVKPNPNADGMLQVNPNVTGQRTIETGVPCKNGINWAFDAKTGEFIYAKATVVQTPVKSVDATGLVTVNPDMIMSDPTKTIAYCPTYLGGRDWPPTAYSPKMNVFFVPLNNICADITAKPDQATPADVYNTDATYKLAPGHTNAGRVDAISVETGDTLWSWDMPAMLYAPVLATAGDLLFTGGMDRYFRALDQTNGKVVWQTRLPSIVSGHTISFAIDGKQYIATSVGGGLVGPGTFKAILGNTDAVTGGNAVYVFALGD